MRTYEELRHAAYVAAARLRLRFSHKPAYYNRWAANQHEDHLVIKFLHRTGGKHAADIDMMERTGWPRADINRAVLAFNARQNAQG